MRDFMFLQDFSDKTILLTHPEDLQGSKRVRVISGDFDINNYTWKSGFGYGFLDYISTPGSNNSEFVYF
jgi:hypothetical protein